MKRTRTTDYEPSALIRINAGGKLYYTTEKTLTANFPDSLIATLFKRKEALPLDEAGNYFLDVDPTLFGGILNVLRRPSLAEIVPCHVKEETWWYELDYWGIRDYVEMSVEDVKEKQTLPQGLASKLGVFKEACETRERQLREIDLLIVDKMLSWCLFNEEITLSQDDNAVGMFCYMARKVVYLQNGKFVNRQEAREGDPDVVLYIENNSTAFEVLMKQVMGFDTVNIDRRPNHESFTFCGVHFEGPGSLKSFIEIEHNYRK